MNGTKPLSTHRELGLSRDAQVFHLKGDRLVLDPEDMAAKVRVRLDRRVNGSGGYVVHVLDEYRDLDAAQVMEGVPDAFGPAVRRVIKLFRTEVFMTRRRKLGREPHADET